MSIPTTRADFSWTWGNDVLYRMCREWPHHADLSVIGGKLWLIGRAYAAQIERGSGKIGKADALYAELAEKIAGSDLDLWLSGISDVRRVDRSNVNRVLDVHRRLISLLESTGRQRRSFASKYLHFHRPEAFFIFDSLAEAEIRRRVRGRFPIITEYREFDAAYAPFVLRCMAYRDREAATREMSPRELDRELRGYS